MSCKLFVTHLHNVRSSQAWLVMLPFGKIPTQPHVFIMYIFFRLHSYQLFVERVGKRGMFIINPFTPEFFCHIASILTYIH